MNIKKIVIVADQIFPMISPRSFRATELAKAFSKKGHDVTLLGTLGDYNYINFEKKYNIKVKDLGTSNFATRNSDGRIKLPIWKLGFIFFLRKFFEFPDIFLMRRVKKAILKSGEIDLLITVAIPFPIHWGASLIKEKDRKFKTWVSDCGDPYMFNSIKKPFFYFKYIEKFWCKKTDYISVPLSNAKDSYYEEFRSKIVEIPQGFNFEEIELSDYVENKSPTFIYAGMFYKEKRDPRKFLDYLTNLKIDFTFIIYTNSKNLVKPYKEVLKNKLIVKKPIGRKDLLLELSKADFLINIKNKNITNQAPSKLIDYTLTKRPVLELSSDFNNKELKKFRAFLNKDYKDSSAIKNIDKYNAVNVASQFEALCL